MGTTLADALRRANIMVFRVVVVAALVALASAGMDANFMNMMQMVQNQMQQHQQQPPGGCNPGTGSGCQVPNGVDITAYMQQQKEQQQYESQQMAEKIKAQFESVMKAVTMRKHRYALSVMTEFTTMCACLKESYTIYQSMFVENAKTFNMTDIVDLDEMANKKPYEASSAKEARELIFGGMLYALCNSLGEYMNFAQQVENNIPIFQNNPPVTPAPGK